MNYRYIPEYDSELKDILERNPGGAIHEIWRSHPALRSMSLDQLSLRIAQLERRLTPFSLK